MQIYRLLLSSIFFVLCFGVPVELYPRAANLQISLRETYKNTERWHFGLVIHAPDGIDGITGQNVRIHEHSISNGCMAYDERQGITKQAQLTETAALLPANGEATDDTLTNAVVEILKQVPSSKIDPLGFNNCLDFAVEAVRYLSTARYVSMEDYARFDAVKTRLGPQVLAKTKAGTLARCKRGPGGSCAMPAKGATQSKKGGKQAKKGGKQPTKGGKAKKGGKK